MKLCCAAETVSSRCVITHQFRFGCWRLAAGASVLCCNWCESRRTGVLDLRTEGTGAGTKKATFQALDPELERREVLFTIYVICKPVRRICLQLQLNRAKSTYVDPV